MAKQNKAGANVKRSIPPRWRRKSLAKSLVRRESVKLLLGILLVMPLVVFLFENIYSLFTLGHLKDDLQQTMNVFFGVGVFFFLGAALLQSVYHQKKK